MLELNDKVLEVVSGGTGSSWSITNNINVKKNYLKISVNNNGVADGSQILIAVTQFNGINGSF